MTEGRATFPIEPWSLTEVGLDHASLAVHESVFALTNGHIGMRGSFEEGEPVVIPGTYLNGFFEERPLPYAEAGYGFPEQGQTMVNVTDGKLIRLLVKDSPLDLDYGEIIDHHAHARPARRRAAPVHRVALAGRPHGAGDQHPAGVAGPPVDRRDRVQGRGHRRPRRPLRRPAVGPAGQRGGAVARSDDPRAAAALAKPLQSELAVGRGRRAVLVHQTKRSQLRMAAGMDHVIEIPDTSTEDIEASGDLARYTLAARIPPGRLAEAGQVPGLRLVLAPVRAPALRDQVEARAGHGQAGRLGAAGPRAAGAARPALGRGRRRDRGRRRAAAGRAGGHVPRPAGRAARRAAADPGQGPDRPRLRRAHLLGHRDLRAAGAHLHRAARGPRRAALAALDPGHGPRAGPGARPQGRGVPVADDPRRGDVGLLAGGDGGLPHQRRHRRRRRPLLQRDPGRRLRPRLRRRTADRDRAAVGVARATSTPSTGSASTA